MKSKGTPVSAGPVPSNEAQSQNHDTGNPGNRTHTDENERESILLFSLSDSLSLMCI